MADQTAAEESKRVVQVIFEDAQILDITGPLEVFAQAESYLQKRSSRQQPYYAISTVSGKAGPIKMSSGLQIVADDSFSQFRTHSGEESIDTLLVAGGTGVYEARKQQELLFFLQKEAKQARRVASICSGTFILAEAGLLHGKAATTHWSVCDLLEKSYSDIRVEADKIFVKDGDLYSSAGVTAGIDLALALVEEDHGRKAALAVAKRLVVFMKRQGGQSQFSSFLAEQHTYRGQLGDTARWIRSNLGSDLSVERLANHSAMSERNFARIFKKETGLTPGKYIEKARVEKAIEQLENSAQGLEDIAARAGFASVEKMRRAFVRQCNVLPHVYRQRFGQ